MHTNIIRHDLLDRPLRVARSGYRLARTASGAYVAVNAEARRSSRVTLDLIGAGRIILAVPGDATVDEVSP